MENTRINIFVQIIKTRGKHIIISYTISQNQVGGNIYYFIITTNAKINDLMT